MAGGLRSRARLALTVLALVASVTSCGGGGSDGGDAVDADARGAGGPKATLGIITTTIETALETRDFAKASEGQRLGVGDRVRTDETGFAEITYHDGSWQRIEQRATLTIVASPPTAP